MIVVIVIVAAAVYAWHRDWIGGGWQGGRPRGKAVDSGIDSVKRTQRDATKMRQDDPGAAPRKKSSSIPGEVRKMKRPRNACVPFPRERSGAAARDREGEPARAAGRLARAHAAPGGARLGADPPAHHHRFQREPARADHRRARRRRSAASRSSREIHQVVYRAIGDEMLWAASMPCNLPADDAIPIGRYGTLEHRAREDRVPHGLVVPLRPAHADHLRHPLQLLAAGHRQRRLLRADPQFPPPVVAAAVSLRRLARGVHELRRGPRARAAGALDAGTLYLPHATSLRMGRLGYQSDAQSNAHR